MVSEFDDPPRMYRVMFPEDHVLYLVAWTDTDALSHVAKLWGDLGFDQFKFERVEGDVEVLWQKEAEGGKQG